MGYALLWIENLAVSLLLMALVLACVGRLHRRWLRVVLWVPAPLVLLLGYAAQTVFTAFLQFRDPTEFFSFWPPRVNWFWQMLALTLSFFAGVVWLSVFGLRRVDETTMPTVAGGWPRGRLAIVLGVAVALHLMTFWNFDSTLRQQMTASQAEASALGLSVAPPRVPDRDNAAILYEQAFQALLSPESWRKVSPENLGHSSSPDQWAFDAKDAGLRPFLRSHAATIALLNKAANKPGCYFEHDYYSPSIGMELTEMTGPRAAARLLVLDARTKAADGDGRGAMQDINTLFAISQHIGAEPTAVSLLVSGSIELQAVETLQRVLLGTSVSSDDLAALRIEDATSYSKLFERVLRFEEAGRLATFCEMSSRREGGGVVGERIMGPLDHVWRVLLLADTLTDHSRVSRQLREMAAQPYYKTRAQWKSLPDEVTLAHADVLTRVFVSSHLAVVAECAAEYDAFRQVPRLALAAEQYRIRHGKLPAKLDELVPNFILMVPPDPFDGKPMRLKQTEHGLIAYSIGPDMGDNGGAPFDRENRTGDITFEVSDRKP